MRSYFSEVGGGGERKLFQDPETHVIVLAQSLIYCGNNLRISGLTLQEVGWKVSSNFDILRFSALPLLQFGKRLTLLFVL